MSEATNDEVGAGIEQNRAINFARGVFIGLLTDAELFQRSNPHGRVLEFGITHPEIDQAILSAMRDAERIGFPFEGFHAFDSNLVQSSEPREQRIFAPFDSIVTRNLQNSTHPGAQLVRFREWLKPGGSLIIQFPEKWSVDPFTDFPYETHPPELWRFTPDCIRELFGWGKFRVETLKRYEDTNLGISFGYAVGIAQ